MEKVDLSTNSKQIQSIYDKIVRGDKSVSYAVFSVDKGAVVSVTESGDGPLEEFVEHFTDGQVQYGLARIVVPGSDVSKNLLLGWCPDNAPSKSRLSFASNFADVSRVLSGYHVQITARDQDDLDVDDFVSRVSAAAGARYSVQSGTTSGSSVVSRKPAPAKPTPSKPFMAPKPSYVPKSTGKPVFGAPPKAVNSASATKPSAVKVKQEDEDEWGGESEIEERDFEKKPLEDVPSAYKPTKVDIESLRKQKSDTVSSTPKLYGINKAEKDQPEEQAKSLQDRMKSFSNSEPSSDGRLTSLPKPKVSHSVASRFTPASTASSTPSFGSKPSFSGYSNDQFKKDKLAGGASRNFASEGGKSPAQIWAEKRGQYKTVPQSSTVSSEQGTVTESLNDLSMKDGASVSSSKDFSDEEANNTPAITFGQSKDEDEGEDKEEQKPTNAAASHSPSPTPPSIPIRNLPPPPVRTVISRNPPSFAKSSEPEEKEASEDESPRDIPPALPKRTESSSNGVSAPPLPKREVAVEKSVTAVAEFDYEKDEDNEIGFKEGELIVDIEFVDDEWWSGKHSITGEIGLFPSSYVVLKDDASEEPKNEKPVAEDLNTEAPVANFSQKSNGSSLSAVAEYDYEKDEDNEIGFAEGDSIVDIEFIDEDWWSGKHETSGEIGLFPANYVRLNS